MEGCPLLASRLFLQWVNWAFKVTYRLLDEFDQKYLQRLKHQPTHSVFCIHVFFCIDFVTLWLFCEHMYFIL